MTSISAGGGAGGLAAAAAALGSRQGGWLAPTRQNGSLEAATLNAIGYNITHIQIITTSIHYDICDKQCTVLSIRHDAVTPHRQNGSTSTHTT